MDSYEFRSFLDLLMCCDPWPCEDGHNEDNVKSAANRMAQERGYLDWIDAYHTHQA